MTHRPTFLAGHQADWSTADTIAGPARPGHGSEPTALSALQQFAADGGGNRIRVWRVVGAATPEALQRACRTVLARHDMLRTCYPERGGSIEHRRLAADALVLRPVDPAAPDEAAIARLLQAEADRPFDVARDLPVRALLLRLPAGERRLAIVVQGLSCDAASLDLIGTDLAAALAGQPMPPAAPAAGQLGWLLRRFAGPDGDADLAWWRERLAAAPPAAVPADHDGKGRAAVAAAASLALPPALADALARDRAGPGDVGPGDIGPGDIGPGDIGPGDIGPDPLLPAAAAALAVLLQRHTGEADVLLGSQMSARRPAPDAGVVGPFATTVALRLDLAGDPAGAALLAQARRVVAAAWAHRLVPFHRLAEILDSDGEAGWDALLPCRLAVRRVPPPGERLAELPGPPAPHGRLGFELRLAADATASLECAYDAALYEAATVRRLLSGWALALAALLQRPQGRLAGIDVLTAAERRQLLVTLNDTACDFPDTPAIRLIEAQARAAPDRVALLCGERQVAYGELAATAGRLAAALARRGIGRGARVGLLLPRGPELVAAVLAVLKRGAAYVPLDPAFPPDRLGYMLADSGAGLVVTLSDLAARLDGAAAPRLQLDRDPWRETATVADGAPEIAPGIAPGIAPEIAPDDGAYVIYTSGSTGRPKGVEVPHRALTNFLLSMRAAPGLQASDTMLFATTLSFDISGLELYLPLLVGARVVVAAQDEASDGAALVRLIRRHGVSVVQAGPTRLGLMLDAGWAPGRPLRILTGGEPVSRRLAERLAPFGEVWTMYGPTETTIWSTCGRVAPAAGPVPIGRPIANTRVYVLDRAGGLVPQGAAGELCIAGAGVATGYVNRPELTEERFPPDPFGPGRMYRTGDRVRWRHDGTLEFLCRLDHQVKLRGVRIEPGEVEAALLRHPGLRQARVLLGRHRTGEDALIAYVVPADPAAWPAIQRELPGRLAGWLPRSMLPQAVVMLPALPLLPNGKVDRGRLPQPAADAADAAANTGAAAGSVEQRLAAIWRDVLKLPSIAREDNFFDLGGTSLLAARLQARIRDMFGRQVPLAALYRAPQLAALAALIARDPPAEAGQTEPVQVVRLQRLGEAPPVFGINNTTVFYPVAVRMRPARPFVAIELRKLQTMMEAPDADLTDLAGSYLAAVRAVRPRGPYALLGWCAGAVLAYDLAQQLAAQDDPVALVAMVDPSAPVPIRSPGLRVATAGRRLQAATVRHGTAVLQRFRRRAAVTVEQELDVVDQQLVAYLERAADAYTPRPYGGKVLLFEPARAFTTRLADPVADWRALVPQASVHRVPGNHVTMLRDAGAQFIAERISEALEDG